MGASITSASDAQLQAIIEQLSIPERCGAPAHLNQMVFGVSCLTVHGVCTA